MAGCSEPPTKEHDQAVAAIEAARTAGALSYAADELAAAAASLKRYDDLVAQRDYKQALSAALDARDRAFESAKSATTKQASLRTEADRLLKSLDTAMAVADADIKASRPASAAKRADKLRQTRKAAAVAVQEARTQVASGELTKAVKRLVDATAAMKRDIASLEAVIKKPQK